MKPDWTEPFTEPGSSIPVDGESAVHVWAIGLTGSPAVLRTLLSADELESVGRLHFADDRRRYIAARGSLRQILGEYSGTPPAELRFCYGERGKPCLESHSALEFNLSHSGDIALLAVTRIGPIGIDVERVRPIEDLLGLARRNFSRSEYETLVDLPEAQHEDSFFRCWTRKEAYVKAVGDGLALSLDDFEVSFAPGDQARFITIGGSKNEGCAWSLESLEPAAGYVGALAVRGQPTTLERWIWQH